MNQETVDQGWQQIQKRVYELLGQFLKVDFPAIEYKTRIAGLLQTSSKYNEQDVEKIS